jgi:hypothetical protein
MNLIKALLAKLMFWKKPVEEPVLTDSEIARFMAKIKETHRLWERGEHVSRKIPMPRQPRHPHV